MRVKVRGTGKGDAVSAFQQLGNSAAARRLVVRVEDPVALEQGQGNIVIEVLTTEAEADAVPVVRALLDQIPGGATAFEVVAIEE